MTTTMPSTAIVVSEPVFSDAERVALAGFSPATADSPERRTPSTFASSPRGARSTASTSSTRDVPTSSASVATSKLAAGLARRSLGACALSPASTAMPSKEELLDHSPAVHVRRPRLDYESHATGLDRNEVGALLWLPDSEQPPSTPSSRFSRSTDCGS